MHDHTAFSNEEFLAAFEECRLSKELWTHEAHVRMAWLYLRRQTFEEAFLNVRKGIQRYNASLGNLSGYHETVTQAYAFLIVSRLRSHSSTTFDEFRRLHPDLFDREKPILLRHYRKGTLASVEARERFVPPDLEPLPTFGREQTEPDGPANEMFPGVRRTSEEA